MTNPSLYPSAPFLFSHVVAANSPHYRAILDVFATAKRQFRLHLDLATDTGSLRIPRFSHYE
jgi:hypothetical protein